ncbi:MAG: alpha/beta hydrolase [Limnobacter sp.]|nr:alpha/beta hydrolase [Limnobacter sp.]
MNPRVPVRFQRAAAELMKFNPLPKGSTCKPWPAGRRGSEIHTPGRIRDADTVILYFHGGGFTIGSPAGHRGLVSQLAKRAGVKTFAASYRLSPESMFPAPQEDGLFAFDTLVKEGYAPENIIVAGDSAGANLSIGVAKQLLERGGPLPKALVLISPVVDFTFEQIPQPVDDTLLPENWALENRWLYIHKNQAKDPLVSPIFGDFKGFPPVFIQSSSAELLSNDSKRLAAALDKAGVPVTWEEQIGLWHDFQLQSGAVKEATEAVQRIGEFVRSLG